MKKILFFVLFVIITADCFAALGQDIDAIYAKQTARGLFWVIAEHHQKNAKWPASMDEFNVPYIPGYGKSNPENYIKGAGVKFAEFIVKENQDLLVTYVGDREKKSGIIIRKPASGNNIEDYQYCNVPLGASGCTDFAKPEMGLGE